MLSLNCKIKVFETDKDLNVNGRVFQFDHVRDIQINSSYKNFTDTAIIEMPKNIVESQLNNAIGIEIARRLPIDLKQRSIHEFFKQDYYIEIFLGYDGEFKPAFRGYITSVKGDAPVQIKCEDFMYVFKKHKMVPDVSISEAKEDCLNPVSPNPSKLVDSSIKTLIEERIKSLPVSIPFSCEVIVEDVCNFLIDRSLNIVQFLEVLKNKFKIYSFFKLEEEKSVLMITNNPLIYEQSELSSILDRFQISSGNTPLPKAILNSVLSKLGITDVINFFKRDNTFVGEGHFRFHYNIIQDQLKVVNLEVKKMRVRAEKYFVNSNTPIFVETGDEEGELVEVLTMHDNNNELPTNELLYKKKEQEVKAELTNAAIQRLANRKIKGLTGTFTTFGEPFIRPTDRVFLTNAEDEEKNGVFQVSEVERSYGISGYRQQITLERQVSKHKTI